MGAIKGKRSFSSMQDAVDAVATNARITASQAADRIRAILAEHPDYATLFADRVQLCASKAPEDLRNLVAARISEHQQAEQARAQKALADAAAGAPDATQTAVAKAQPDPAAEAARHVERNGPDSHATTFPGHPAFHGIDTASKREVVKIKLGQLVDLIAPLKIDAEGLRQLGFEPMSTERGSKLYDASQIDAMRGAMIRHLQQPLPDTHVQPA